QVMAVLAFQRNDVSCIAENMDAWCFAVQQYPTTPGILSALANAASLLPDSASILVLLLDLASRHDVQKISVLFDVIESFLDEESVSQALKSLIAQEERPLPPQTLCEYHRLFPKHTSLKEYAILAILRSLDAERIEDWTPRTQQKILETLHDAVSTETLMRVIDTLRGRSFRETEIYLFGIACNTVPLVSEESWKSKAFTELQAIAFQQKDYASLERSLSFLIQGVSKSDDLNWIKTRIDEVLSQAADINPDTSVLRSACAEAQAHLGRWEQAIQIAFEITNPGVHDKTLCALMDMVLKTHRVDRLNIAISMVAGISDYLRRREQLLLLQKEEALVEDMVAFGQVVQLLLDYPEELRSFVSDSVLRKSELGSVNLMTLQAHTDREQHLLSLRDQRWLEVIASEAPHLVDSLRTVMEL
ncbi:MAG: hypothetical protein VX278_17650, partial [Myxococcota bacterium]|nr:hypothetical protein [Myxococcota bacterium]